VLFFVPGRSVWRCTFRCSTVVSFDSWLRLFCSVRVATTVPIWRRLIRVYVALALLHCCLVRLLRCCSVVHLPFTTFGVPSLLLRFHVVVFVTVVDSFAFVSTWFFAFRSGCSFRSFTLFAFWLLSPDSFVVALHGSFVYFVGFVLVRLRLDVLRLPVLRSVTPTFLLLFYVCTFAFGPSVVHSVVVCCSAFTLFVTSICLFVSLRFGLPFPVCVGRFGTVHCRVAYSGHSVVVVVAIYAHVRVRVPLVAFRLRCPGRTPRLNVCLRSACVCVYCLFDNVTFLFTFRCSRYVPVIVAFERCVGGCSLFPFSFSFCVTAFSRCSRLFFTALQFVVGFDSFVLVMVGVVWVWTVLRCPFRCSVAIYVRVPVRWCVAVVVVCCVSISGCCGSFVRLFRLRCFQHSFPFHLLRCECWFDFVRVHTLYVRHVCVSLCSLLFVCTVRLLLISRC